MTDPVTGHAVGGVSLYKFFGSSMFAASVAVAVGFLFLWPKTLKEAFVRITCTIMASSMFGPFMVMALHSWWPSLFDSSKTIAGQADMDPNFGLLFLAAPIMVLAGLPAWWVMGAIIRWLDRRRNADIGELVHDARQIIRPTSAPPGADHG